MSESLAKTVDPEEASRFERLALLWWDPQGPFRPLHRMNQLRTEWIRDQVLKYFDRKPEEGTQPLSGLRALDIGCGGGILSEAMARLGARVTGIDVVERNLQIAKRHAEKEGLPIQYRCIAVEDLSQEGEMFDVVLNMEVVEHVADLPLFLKSVSTLVRPGGLMIVATLNRTVLSYWVAIVGAELVFRWLPKGTHQWRKFVTPPELTELLKPHGLVPVSRSGVWMNPLSHRFLKVPSMAVNYMIAFTKSAHAGSSEQG